MGGETMSTPAPEVTKWPEIIKAERAADIKRQEELGDKLVADGFLSVEERELVKETFNSDKEALKNFIIAEKADFIESDFWKRSEDLVWKNNISKINNALWVKWSEFSTETFKAVIKFQRENNLGIDWIVWPNTLKAILWEWADTSETIKEDFWNIKEIADYAVNKVIDMYFDKIEQDWGIDLSIESMYSDVLDILDSIQAALPESNIFKDQFPAIRNNFFMPKEKWYETIRIINARLSESDNMAESWININVADVKHMMIAGIWTLFDIAQTSSPEELQKIINEFSTLPQIKEITEQVPDFNIIFTEILPSAVDTIDKEDFIANLSKFFDNVAPNIEYLIKHRWETIPKSDLRNIKLNIIRESADFISNTINEDSIDALSDGLKELSFISNSEIAKDILELTEKLTSKEKLEFTKDILDLLKVLSHETIDEEKFNDLSGKLVNKLNLFANKIWSTKIIDFLQKHWLLKVEEDTPEPEKPEEDQSFLDKLGDLWESAKEKYSDFKEIAKVIIEALRNPEQREALLQLIRENKNEIKNIVEEYAAWKLDWKTSAELLKYFLDKDILWKIIKKMWKWFSDRINKILNTNISKLALEARNGLIDNINIWQHVANVDPDSKLGEASLMATQWIIWDIYKVIVSKINASTKEWQFLSKQELIQTWLDSIKKLLNNPENKELFVDILEEAGIKLPPEAHNRLKQMADNILSHPKMNDIIENILSSVHKRVDNSETIMQDLIDLAKESNREFIEWIIKENSDDIIDMWVDTLFGSLLNNPEGSKILLWVLENNLWIKLNLSQENIVESIEILKKHLDIEKLKAFIKENKDLAEKWADLSMDDIIKLGWEFYDLIDDKNWFIQELADSGIIKEALNSPSGIVDTTSNNNSNTSSSSTTTTTTTNNNSWETSPEWSKFELINDTTLEVAIDSLYDTMQDWKEEDFVKTAETIMKELWLEGLLEQKILWQNVADISYEFFSCIDKEDLTNILKNNKDTLKDILAGKQDISDIANLATEIFSEVDIKKLQKILDTSWVSNPEAVWLDLADEIQGVIKENPEKMVEMSDIMEDLVNIYESGKKIEKWSELAEKIRVYWEKMFDLIHSIISKIDDNYLHQNLNLNQNSKSESSDSKKETKDEKESKVQEIISWFGKSFGLNNIWFLFWNCLDSVNALRWKPGQLIDDYFRDTEHRDDFGDTLHDFMIDSSNK